MRANLLFCLLLIGCVRPYDHGFDDGCIDGALDGAMWGGVDAALCYTSRPVPGDPGGGSSLYDRGYYDGYVTCFPGSYVDAYDAAMFFLEEDLGPCEELLE